MKKILVASLIAVSAINLVGCGGKSAATGLNTNDKKVELVIQVESTSLKYYEKVKETVLEKNPNAEIKFIELGNFDHLDILDMTDPSNPDVADVFSLPADRLYTLANNNALAAIDAEAMAERIGGFKNFTDGLGGNFKINGEYLAFPSNIETLISFVNIENAKAAGIDYTKPIEFTELNFNQMLTILHDCWFGVAFANSANFEFLNKDKDGKLLSDATKPYSELTKEQKELFEAIFNYWKAHNDAKTPLWDKDAAGGYIDENFKTGGPTAIRIGGPWETRDITTLVGDVSNLEVMPLTNITVNGNPLVHWKSGWGLGVNARIEDNEDKMELAEQFIQETLNPNNAIDIFRGTGAILPNVEASAYEGVEPIEMKVIQSVCQSYEKAPARHLFTEYGEVWGSWQNSVLSWAAKKPTNAEEAYKEVKASFDSMMENFRK